ncbi:MAG: AAA family ATPase [Herpetosiphonaceae bacterium]|nr:AAA family ATPase [Herpetosiphonaceae bacterium]
MTTPTTNLTTGVPGLDVIVDGGLSPGALVFLVGAPGAGKTILASQILFHVVKEDNGPAVIFTVFSEGNTKLLDHLRRLTFFDEQLVGHDVTLLSLERVLGTDPDAMASAIVREIRQSGARVVLIDGFQGVIGLLADDRTIRRTLARIATLIAYLDVTVLVTMAGSSHDPHLSTTLTTADLVLGLEYAVEGRRHTRRLEVVKQRGRRQLPGLHPYSISDAGVRVFPRLEVRPHQLLRPRPHDLAPFGLPDLDALLGGGVAHGSATLLAGPPGSGKTTLGLYWALADATPATATLWLSVAEYPDQLQAKAASFGLDLAPALATGALVLVRLSPVELQPDAVASQLLDALSPGTQRLIIDDIASLIHELGARAPDYLNALREHLYVAGVTSLFVLDIEGFTGFGLEVAHAPLLLLAENILVVQQQLTQNRLHRMLAILKMHFTGYDQRLRELVLDGHGIRVLAPDETVGAVVAPVVGTDERSTPSRGNQQPSSDHKSDE